VRAGVATLLMSTNIAQRVLRHYGPATDHDLETAMKLMYALNLRELVLIHPSPAMKDRVLDKLDAVTRWPLWVACWLLGVALDEWKIRKVNRSIRGR
jgi:hypothetical protein